MKEKLKLILYGLVLLIGIAALKLMSEIDYQTRKTDKIIWKLKWSDEFDYEGSPNSDLWTYDLGNGCPSLCGWGNRELQYYTQDPKNVRVENGHLIIEALKETISNSTYSSARIKSTPKNDIKYGKVEVRLKCPSGIGTWPAAWMLPTKNSYGIWPASGEIDIMEHVGYEKKKIYGTVHTTKYNHLKATQKGGEIKISDAEENFHVYSIIWTADYIEFYVDDKSYFLFENEKENEESWPFDQKFHLILNLAMGGSWGGKKGIEENLDNIKYYIDYVRVYEDDSPKRIF